MLPSLQEEDRGEREREEKTLSESWTPTTMEATATFKGFLHWPAQMALEMATRQELRGL